MSSSKIIQTRYKDWIIGSVFPVQPGQVKQLTRLADHPLPNPITPLGGRSPVVRTRMDGIGTVIVKKYLRGGLMQRFSKDRYVKTGPCRARSEFEILLKAARYDINVPCPVFYLQKGSLLYQCWLVTKEIPNCGTIAQISLADPESARYLLKDVAHQVQKLIKKKIYHVDFHPGNVLAGLDKKVYLLDFDKAVITQMGEAALAKKYIERWNRAIVKHDLPKLLLQNSFL